MAEDKEDHVHNMHDSVLTVRQNDRICASKVIIAKELPAAPIGGSARGY